jgi:hypothetical protein
MNASSGVLPSYSMNYSMRVFCARYARGVMPKLRRNVARERRFVAVADQSGDVTDGERRRAHIVAGQCHAHLGQDLQERRAFAGQATGERALAEFQRASGVGQVQQLAAA